MEKNYTYTLSNATKTTITISRRALWDNYISSWGSIAWDCYAELKNTKELEEVASILCVGELNIMSIRSLFKKGYSFFLLGDAMKLIELPSHERDNTLFEIIVEDGENRFVIPHDCIDY